ncbi:TetR/AcrR family transcriptional regulator [Arthrobacter sp. 31Y]|uniref:TetR/AcrR family transcriptional regulator n=1 Tax=Arthrobacter sp. 31Y TaxID=1115632 RepID=UPI000464318A|nr:TetR/AcrR family transcriptional regulator [Arthrobacter sp. 31Y]
MSAEDGVSEAPESVWSRPVRKTRGPVPLHSRESIAAAGIKIADDEGFQSVTMRSIARALGMVAPALYRYVNSREEIVELMVDAAIGAPPSVEPGPAWTDAMLNLANTQLRHHQSHTWLIQAALEAPSFGPNTLAWFEAYLTAMKELDASTERKMELIALVTGVVSLFAQQQQSAGSAFPFELLSVERHPNLATALSKHSGQTDSEGPFNRAVLALCKGLIPSP